MREALKNKDQKAMKGAVGASPNSSVKQYYTTQWSRSFKCGRCQRGAEWRAADPVGESPKTPVSNVISPFDSRHLLSLESVKLGELKEVSEIRLPDWRPNGHHRLNIHSC
uniref:Uncharacterized protein n=1 Tax=Solanum tuberosum TaxID=4113 RepID=M1DE93_SOLTU